LLLTLFLSNTLSCSSNIISSRGSVNVGGGTFHNHEETSQNRNLKYHILEFFHEYYTIQKQVKIEHIIEPSNGSIMFEIEGLKNEITNNNNWEKIKVTILYQVTRHNKPCLNCYIEAKFGSGLRPPDYENNYSENVSDKQCTKYAIFLINKLKKYIETRSKFKFD